MMGMNFQELEVTRNLREGSVIVNIVYAHAHKGKVVPCWFPGVVDKKN